MKVPPLPPDLEELLRAERDFPAEPGERQARVLAAVKQAIVAAPAVPSGSGPATPAADGGGAAPAGGGAGPSSPAASATPGLATGAGAATAGIGRIAVVAAIAFAAGGGAGAGLYHVLAGPGGAARGLPPDGPSASATAAGVDDGAAPVDASGFDGSGLAPPGEADVEGGVPIQVEPPTPVVPSSPMPRPEAAPSGESGSGPDAATVDERARERQLIEVARAAVARGNPAEALEAVRRHAEQFPRGRLTEEREALRILALVSAGRRAEASRRAEAFRRAHPGSVFGPAIDRALAASRAAGDAGRGPGTEGGP